MIDKEKYLRAKLKDFQHIFNQTAEIYEYAFERGGPRESAVRGYLKSHLPKRFGVTTGKVLNPEGELTKQIDIIIYDALNCPIIYKETKGVEYQIIPADSAIGDIEVKSIVTPEVLKDSIANLKSFGNVVSKFNKKIVCGFWGYATPVFAKQIEVDLYFNTLQSILAEVRDYQYIKNGIILPNTTNINVTGKIIKKVPCFLYLREDATLDATISRKKKKLKKFPVLTESDPEVILSAYMMLLTDNLNKWKPHSYSTYKYHLQFGK